MNRAIESLSWRRMVPCCGRSANPKQVTMSIQLGRRMEAVSYSLHRGYRHARRGARLEPQRRGSSPKADELIHAAGLDPLKHAQQAVVEVEGLLYRSIIMRTH
jgi:hypothetical protein